MECHTGGWFVPTAPCHAPWGWDVVGLLGSPKIWEKAGAYVAALIPPRSGDLWMGPTDHPTPPYADHCVPTTVARHFSTVLRCTQLTGQASAWAILDKKVLIHSSRHTGLSGCASHVHRGLEVKPPNH